MSPTNMCSYAGHYPENEIQILVELFRNIMQYKQIINYMEINNGK